MFKLIFSFLLLNLFTLSLSYAFDIKQLTERANSGDISSQLDLARSYLNKDNVQQNNKLAFQWFQKAAENSNPSAQFQLGRMYHKGIGTNQDNKQAIKWLKLAVNNFDNDAQLYLGQLYYDGEIIEQNYAKAFSLIKKAAIGEGGDQGYPFFVEDKSGNADAQFKLGQMYALGEGVDGNFEMAIQWLEKSASSGDSIKQYDLAEMFLLGRLIPKNLEKALYWRNQAAENGNRDSLFATTNMYKKGSGTEKNDQLAISFFKSSSSDLASSLPASIALLYQSNDFSRSFSTPIP